MDDLRYSRLDATVARLAEGSDAHRFTHKSVLLTASADALHTENGREIARCALRLLIKMCRRLTVAMPAGAGQFQAELEGIALELGWDQLPSFVDGGVDQTGFDAVLAVGGAPHSTVPRTVVTSSGWLARVTSTATPISQDMSSPNPVGALAAASLGVAEVFKRLIKVRPERGVLADGWSFSLWSYRIGDDDAGPHLPARMAIDALLVGGGSIGNGVAHLLGSLPLVGSMETIDKQSYGEENWGTSLRVRRCDAENRVPKAAFTASLLGNGVVTKYTVGDVASLKARTGWKPPPVIFNALDNVSARHQVQKLWPDLVIDGAIGSDLSCQASCHPWPAQTACLLCIFQEPPGRDAIEVQMEATGLSAASLQHAGPDDPLTEEDVENADPAKQEWLRSRIGQPKCSVVIDAQSLSLDEQDESFEPSVPFVATMAACMMVTEFVRHATTGTLALDPRFQFNLLVGPQVGVHFPEDRRAECMCVQRAQTIHRVRAERA